MYNISERVLEFLGECWAEWLENQDDPWECSPERVKQKLGGNGFRSILACGYMKKANSPSLTTRSKPFLECLMFTQQGAEIAEIGYKMNETRRRYNTKPEMLKVEYTSPNFSTTLYKKQANKIHRKYIEELNCAK